MRPTRLSAPDDDRGALAVDYLRVSTSRQLSTGVDVDANGNSITAQRVATLRKVGELGAVVERLVAVHRHCEHEEIVQVPLRVTGQRDHRAGVGVLPYLGEEERVEM